MSDKAHCEMCMFEGVVVDDEEQRLTPTLVIPDGEMTLRKTDNGLLCEICAEFSAEK